MTIPNDEIRNGDINISFPKGEETAPEEKTDKEEKAAPASPSDEKKPTEESPSHQGDDAKTDEEKEKDKKAAEEAEKQKQNNTGDDNEKIPFHKHPRWKRINEENQQLKETVAQQEERLKKLEEKPIKSDESDNKIPDWFINKYGDDQEEWAKYLLLKNDLKTEIKKEAEEEAKKNQEEVKKKEIEGKKTITKWEEWIDDNLQKMEDDGKQFDRNELLKIMDEYRPTDSNGNLDFNKAYEILELKKQQAQEDKQKKNDVKKKIAAQTIDQGKPTDSSKGTGIMTPTELRGKSFHDLIN